MITMIIKLIFDNLPTVLLVRRCLDIQWHSAWVSPIMRRCREVFGAIRGVCAPGGGRHSRLSVPGARRPVGIILLKLPTSAPPWLPLVHRPATACAWSNWSTRQRLQEGSSWAG
jgi:hypothetical protein